MFLRNNDSFIIRKLDYFYLYNDFGTFILLYYIII